MKWRVPVLEHCTSAQWDLSYYEVSSTLFSAFNLSVFEAVSDDILLIFGEQKGHFLFDKARIWCIGPTAVYVVKTLQ